MSWRKYLLALLLMISLPVLAEAACPVPNVYPFAVGCPLPAAGLNAAIAAASTAGSGLTVGTSAITGGTSGRILFDNAGTLGEATVGTGLSLSGGNLTAPAASTSTAGITKLHNVPVSIGWVAAVDPNNAVIAVINQASTISAIIGAVETATGTAATVTVKKAPSGTPCSSGTALHSGTFNANGTAATNQTLTVTTSAVSVGDRLCVSTTGTTAWTGGAGIGTLTVFLAPS